MVPKADAVALCADSLPVAPVVGITPAEAGIAGLHACELREQRDIRQGGCYLEANRCSPEAVGPAGVYRLEGCDYVGPRTSGTRCCAERSELWGLGGGVGDTGGMAHPCFLRPPPWEMQMQARLQLRHASFGQPVHSSGGFWPGYLG